MQLVFNVPSKDAPGFYYRQKRVLELKQQKTDNPTVATLDAIVDFLADYVQAENHDEAVKFLQMASEAQWDELLGAVGGAPSGEIPPLKSES